MLAGWAEIQNALTRSESLPTSMSHVAKQPTLFEVFGRSETPSVPEINESSLQALVTILLSGDHEEGKVVLLHSPRAGYGKTLLLHAASEQTGDTAKFFAVEPSGGGRLDGEVVLESLLRQLANVLPGSGGLTEFDFLTRRLLAIGLKPLLISGEIPSHDREGALYAIEQRPIETFDFHHQQAATAHWTQANFEVLGPRLASELSEFSNCSLRDCAYWVDLLFRYATSPPEKVERTRLLSDSVFAELQSQGAGLAEERLQSLLGLLSLLQPVVLVFDETEGLSNQPEAGLRVAAFIAQLRQACPGLTVILSVNEDVWETGLTPLMPGGLRDRLTEYVVNLTEMTRSEAEALLQSRFGDAAGLITSRLEWPEPLYARALLKESAGVARDLAAAGYFAELSESVNAPTEKAAVTASTATPPPLEMAPTAEPAVEEQSVETEESPFAAAPAVAAVSAGVAEVAPAQPVAEVTPKQMSPDFAEPAPVEELSPFEIVPEPAEAEEVPLSVAPSPDARDFAAEVAPVVSRSEESPAAILQAVAEEAPVAESSSASVAGSIFQVASTPAATPQVSHASEANPFTIAEPSEALVPQPASQPILPQSSPFQDPEAAPATAGADFSAPPTPEPAPPVAATEPSVASVDQARDWVARQAAPTESTSPAPAPVAEVQSSAAASPFEASATPPSLPQSASAPASSSTPAQASPFAAQQPATPSPAQVAAEQSAESGGDNSEVEELLNQFKQRFGQGGKS